MKLITVVMMAACLMYGTSHAESTMQMNIVDEKGSMQPAGQITLNDTQYGLVLNPTLSGLPPGLHGFHVHEFGSCDSKEKDGKLVPALAAGGHYDPGMTKQHSLPWGNGHLGDLPALYVDMHGAANNPVLAPRLKLADIAGKSLMIHAGGDNHSDSPAALGGGGMRIACGVIPQ